MTYLRLLSTLACLPLLGACVIINDGGGSDSDADTTSSTSGSGTSGSTGGSSTSGASSTSTAGSGSTSTAGSGSDTGTAGTGGGAACGWGPTGAADPPEGYVCGGQGEDPSGTYPYACPDGLMAGGPCGNVTGVGCCDADGNLWYCTGTGQIYQQTCG